MAALTDEQRAGLWRARLRGGARRDATCLWKTLYRSSRAASSILNVWDTRAMAASTSKPNGS